MALPSVQIVFELWQLARETPMFSGWIRTHNLSNMRAISYTSCNKNNVIFCSPCKRSIILFVSLQNSEL